MVSYSLVLFFLVRLHSLWPCHGYDGDALDSTGCPSAFQEKCHCGKQRFTHWRPDEELFVVNCTNTGFTDTSMLDHFPKGIQVLVFNGNRIQVLDWNVLGLWDEHEDLEVIKNQE